MKQKLKITTKMSTTTITTDLHITIEDSNSKLDIKLENSIPIIGNALFPSDQIKINVSLDRDLDLCKPIKYKADLLYQLNIEDSSKFLTDNKQISANVFCDIVKN